MKTVVDSMSHGRRVFFFLQRLKKKIHRAAYLVTLKAILCVCVWPMWTGVIGLRQFNTQKHCAIVSKGQVKPMEATDYICCWRTGRSGSSGTCSTTVQEIINQCTCYHLFCEFWFHCSYCVSSTSTQSVHLPLFSLHRCWSSSCGLDDKMSRMLHLQHMSS